MEQTALPPYKALREATGLTQREVERRLGWKTGHLSVIERGLVPTEDQRRALLVFFHDELGKAIVREEQP